MNKLLEDKTVLISGVGLGLGRSLAIGLANEGAKITLAARTESTLQSIAKEVKAITPNVLVAPTDITDAAQCQKCVDATIKEFGRIDILIHNAAPKNINPKIPFEKVNLD